MTMKKKTTKQRRGSHEDGTSLSAYVRERIRRAIQEGAFQPGARLRESVLCDWLQVSRTPVREAVMALMAEGMLVALPSRGTVVNELDRYQMSELYAMRCTVEGAAARLASQFLTNADIDFLEELNHRLKESDDPKLQAALNRKFHATIFAACRNRYLIASLKALETPVALLPGTGYSVMGRPSAAHDEHKALISALRDRDADAAENCAKEHLRAAERARMTLMVLDPVGDQSPHLKESAPSLRKEAR
jgi:DNA-binding GntR family transcriptional regulator